MTTVAADSETIPLRVDATVEYQTIDGFGAFGGRDVNWHDPERWYNEQWLDRIINDLGLTIHRNEYYPEGDDQDTSFEAQKPFLKALQRKAEEDGVPLKFVVSFWTPPAYMKDNDSHKRGGHVLPEYYDDLGRFAVQCLEDYRSIGIDVYALSLQNEPHFSTHYNSCVYTPQEYREMLKVAGPIIKEQFPEVKLFGPEHMVRSFQDLEETYEYAIMEDAQADQWLDVWAVHGYLNNGEDADPEATSPESWHRVRDALAPTGKPIWMTESSGYRENWPEARSLGAAMLAALRDGDISAWIWWQLGSPAGDRFALMKLDQPTKRYYVSKQFFRYIRPGAVRVECACEDGGVRSVAFKHPEDHTVTVVLINPDEDEAAEVALEMKGSRLPESFTVHRTSAEQNCAEVGEARPGGKVALPPSSITTLHGTAEAAG